MALKKNVFQPTLSFLIVAVGYVLLLSLTSILNWGILKALSYLAAIAIFMAMFLVWANMPKSTTKMPEIYFAMGAYYTGLLCCLIVNNTLLDYSVLIKLILAPAFLVFGANFELQNNKIDFSQSKVKILFFTLVFAPLVVLFWQKVKNISGLSGASDFSLIGAGKEFSIFSNKNNAALYAVSLMALFNVVAGKPLRNTFIILGVGICFGTLGVFLAVLLSLFLCVGKVRLLQLFIPSFIIISGLYFFNPDLIIFSRITPVVDSVILLWNGSIDITTVTYAELVRLLNTTDLSFLFRLKHWANLLDIYWSGNIYQWMFGFGIGSSVHLSDIHLVPHNDYLRYLFECGALTFLGFLLLILFIIRGLGRRWEAIPILTIAFYFFSENLVNNYIAMAIFYFCAGALIARIRHDKLKLVY